MRYVSSDIIIAEVKNILGSWFDSNTIDDSILYPGLEYCISKFPLKYAPKKSTILEVDCKEADLPSDFRKLKLALACGLSKYQNYDRYDETINTEERHVCELNLCESKCDVCHDDCGNMFKIVQTFNRRPEKIVWDRFELVCATEDSLPYCDKNCFNKQSGSKHEIKIEDNKIKTNFDKALVYIEYIAKFKNDSDYSIIDNETIIEWIKANLIKDCFKYIYYNGMGDVLQRLQHSERECAIKETNAIAMLKKLGPQDFYKVGNVLIKRFNKHTRQIWDSKLHNERWIQSRI